MIDARHENHATPTNALVILNRREVILTYLRTGTLRETAGKVQWLRRGRGRGQGVSVEVLRQHLAAMGVHAGGHGRSTLDKFLIEDGRVVHYHLGREARRLTAATCRRIGRKGPDYSDLLEVIREYARQPDLKPVSAR